MIHFSREMRRKRFMSKKILVLKICELSRNYRAIDEAIKEALISVVRTVQTVELKYNERPRISLWLTR